MIIDTEIHYYDEKMERDHHGVYDRVPVKALLKLWRKQELNKTESADIFLFFEYNVDYSRISRSGKFTDVKP